MWRRGPFNPTMPVPTEHPNDGSESHIHSPRHRSEYSVQPRAKDAGAGFLGSTPNTLTFLENTTYADPLNSHFQANSATDIDWTASLVPSELATSLTNSLLNQPIPVPRKTSSTNSPPSSRTFSGVFSSRSASGSVEFGQNLTNVNPVVTFMNAESNGEKVAKRSRHATPASVRALEEDDEPKRSTPKVRIGFGEDMAN